MSYQSDIMTALLADETVSGLVGTRIFADIADGTAAAPFVVYSIPSTDGETCQDGTREVEFPSVQFSIYAATKADAITIADAIDLALDGQELAGTSGTSLQFSNRFGQYESDTKLFGEVLEYRASVKSNH